MRSAANGVHSKFGVRVRDFAAGEASSVVVPAGDGEDRIADELLRHARVDVGIESARTHPSFDDSFPVASEFLLEIPDPHGRAGVSPERSLWNKMAAAA